MISSKLAQAIVNRTAIDFGTESIPLDRALGRTLREDIHSDRDLPPYDRVTMDGIAIKFETFADGSKYFPIEGTAAAGKEQFELKDKNNCVEVMTGAVLPKGTDTIIQYEWLEISDGGAHIVKEDFVQGKNVHAKGTDRAAGSLVIPKDRLIGAAEIGLAATFGKHELLVSKRPDVAIVSTGDELVEIHEQPLPHQIRKSNVHMIEHSVVPFANTITRVHLQDDLDATVNTLRGLLDKMPLI
ncbi:MAG: molybdopterin molybdotransferase MoeA, partial [Bacteroidota bacterium]